MYTILVILGTSMLFSHSYSKLIAYFYMLYSLIKYFFNFWNNYSKYEMVDT